MFQNLLRSVRVSMKEAQAFAKQATLLAKDVEELELEESVREAETVAVVLHGLFASAGVLRPLRARLERGGEIRTASLSYAPHRGVHEVARRVEKLLGELRPDARIVLVGHSLGGVVTRYVAVTSQDPRIVCTVAMASPFGGVRGAHLVGLGSAPDLDPDSEVLRTIRTARLDRPIPHLSILGGADVLFKSPVAHALPDGDVTLLEDRGHNSLLFDDECLHLVERRVRLALA